MSDYPGGAWLTRYRERVNGDAELKVIGDWFTTTFGLTFGDTRYAVKVERGSIIDIVTPKLDTRTPLENSRAMLEPSMVFQKRLGEIHDVDVATDVLKAARSLPAEAREQALLALAKVREKRIGK